MHNSNCNKMSSLSKPVNIIQNNTLNDKTKNLTNLRDVLKATHQMRNQQQQQQQYNNNNLSDQIEEILNNTTSNQLENHENLKHIIDSMSSKDRKESILKFTPSSIKTSTNNNSNICVNVKQCYSTISNEFNKDINKENALTTLMSATKNIKKITTTTTNLQNNSSIIQIKNNHDNSSAVLLKLEQIDEEIVANNSNNVNNLVKKNNSFNRNDLIRRNISIKSQEDKKKLLTFSKNFNSFHPNTDEVSNSVKRNSIEQIPLKNVVMRSKPVVKQSASFNLDKNTNNNNNELEKKNCSNLSSESSSTYWKYDELNDLRMKFISLLGPNENSNDNSKRLNLNLNLSNEESLNKVIDDQALKFGASQPTQITESDRLKIESFYRSFGTSLFVCNSSACLYTINNSRKNIASASNTLQKSSTLNRASIQSQTKPVNYEIDQETMKHIITNCNEQKNNEISVSHCGIPLWLFNSGQNPRRPNRQIKFTLAEKGTGFILWQDRIDLNSNLKMFTIKKDDSSNLIQIDNLNNYLLLFNNEENDSNINETHLPFLISFRASDKKTNVLIRFDLNNEAIRFYNHYLDLMKKMSEFLMMSSNQRAKSLPAGLTSNISHFKNSNSKSNTFKLDKSKSKLTNNNNYNKAGTLTRNIETNYQLDYVYNNRRNNSKLKRQSCFMTFNLNHTCTHKIKKITKNDISNPTNPRHITNIKSKDRNFFYTLSKLLPSSMNFNNKTKSKEETTDLNLISDINTNKLTPSPTYSILTSSSASANLTDSSNVITIGENNLIEDSSMSLISESFTNKSKVKSSSSSSSSSSSISPSFIKIKNQSDETDEKRIFNNNENCFTKMNEMRNFEARKNSSSIFSRHKTLK